MVAVVCLAAFALSRDQRRRAVALGVGCALVAWLHEALATGAGNAWLLCGLLLAAACAAQGLASLARVMGAPKDLAAVTAFTVLAVSMSGLFWADPVADGLRPQAAYRVRQAALDLDLATALAYGASDYDRLHDADVYAHVPLASSTHHAPTGGPTALVWLVVGVLGTALARLLRPAAGVAP